MIFHPALITDLDAVERHYTELLTHEAETGRSSTNWSLGVYPTRQTAAAALYQKNGFTLRGSARVLFQGKIPEELICLEAPCRPADGTIAADEK